MTPPVRVKTTVLPGNRIEVATPGLAVGAEVQVIVLPAVGAADPPPADGKSFLEIIEEMPPGRLFKSAEEVDAYLREERDSWER
jgi:hypothetical protein